MTETLMISTEEKIQLVKNERLLEVMLAKKNIPLVLAAFC